MSLLSGHIARFSAIAAFLTALPACLDRMLEAPYVLAKGVGEAKAISPRKEGFYVGGEGGVFEVGADGTARQISAQSVDALTALADGWASVRGDQVCASAPGRCMTVPGARDLIGWYGKELRVLAGDRVIALPICLLHAPDAGGCPDRETREIVGGLTGALGVAYGEGRRWLVWTDRELLSFTEAANAESGEAPLVREVLWSGMTKPHAVGVDGRGRVFVVQGEEPALYRVEGGAGVLAARWMEGVTDLHAGSEQGRLGGMLYFSNSAGRVDFLQPG